MARSEKVVAVEEIREKIGNAKIVVLVDFTGLNVHQVGELRNALREKGVEYRVFKNTLICIAAKDKKLEGLDEFLVGSTALVLGYDDELVAPKLMAKFSKEHGVLKVKGGILQGKVIDASRVKKLANLPPYEELLAKLMGSMQSPISGFTNVLAGPLRGLVNVLDAVGKQKAS
ncbi:MAG TPA: 50S ribosomal protein L10 [Actinobacteria bacterium]|nr:50S ribosomal protein L10 [Actinomycetota bacterium]